MYRNVTSNAGKLPDTEDAAAQMGLLAGEVRTYSTYIQYVPAHVHELVELLSLLIKTSSFIFQFSFLAST